MKETYWKDDVRSVKWTHPVLHSSENWSIAVPVPLLRSACHSPCSWPMLQQHGPARSALIGHLWASDPNRNWSGWSSLSLRNCLNFWGFWGHWTKQNKAGSVRTWMHENRDALTNRQELRLQIHQRQMYIYCGGCGKVGLRISKPEPNCYTTCL